MRTDGRKDGRTDMTNLTVANAPKTADHLQNYHIPRNI